MLPWLQIRGLSKRYGGVEALQGVDLTLTRGEVHGLVGANGAGKSTLVRLLAGLDVPDTGTILLDGQRVSLSEPRKARQLGFAFIHQELHLVPKFSAVANMTLGLRKPRRFGVADWRARRRAAAHVAQRLGIAFSLDTPVEQLSVAERWLVSIGRALIRQASLMVMDEPTASLSAVESERLFHIIGELSASGIAVIYVSHRLEEILTLCERVTVLRDGTKVFTKPRAQISKRLLIRAIVGTDITPSAALTPAPRPGRIVLEARQLRRGTVVRDISFSLHAGEILGLAGLVGAGRTELARLLCGVDRIEAGEVWLGGRPIRCRGPRDAVRLGICLVPEDRRAEGLVLTKAIDFNVNLPALRQLRSIALLPFISRRRGGTHAAAIAQRLRVKAPSVSTVVQHLSGGNQQKVVIGKWLARHARVFILDEVTRGVDVGARREIHTLVGELAQAGAGLIVISSEVEELVGLCHRVLVMAQGRLVGTLHGEQIRKDTIMRLCYGEAQGTE